MDFQDLLPVFQSIQSCPTAPFHEYHVRDEILRQLSELPDVTVASDAFGNLIATYRRGDQPGRLAFGAHMDHPAYVRSPESGEFEFLGGVPQVYRDANPPTREYGEFAMWDLPEFEVRDGRIYSRVCDDLVGCAAMVCLFRELQRLELETTCHALFTRGEEVGFVGAIHLAQTWPFEPGVRFVSLETSAPVPGVEMGGGPVIRVGDAKSVFDTDVSGDMVFAATAEGIQTQRALLDRGSCEATAMQYYGVPAAGISVLLGNYHNCAPDNRIDSEYIDIRDATGLVELIVALVKCAGSESPARVEMGQRFDQRVAEHQPYVEATLKRFLT